MVLITLLGIVAGILAILFAFIQWRFTFFKRIGVPYLKPRFPFGNINTKKLVCYNIQDIYVQLKDKSPICGFFMLHEPFGIPLNLDMVKRIMIKDFHHFENRGIYFNEKDEPLTANLLTETGEKWRKLRANLTPTFTSGKMKFMFPTIIDCSKYMEQYLDELTTHSTEVEVKDLLARFTTDVIGTCAFGIDCNSFKDPNADFRKMGKRAVEDQKYPVALFFIFCSNISFFNKLGIKTTQDDVHDFFMTIVRETVEYRKTNSTKRNDFMDILMNIKLDGGDSMTLNGIAAQVFLFFLAGFETSSTTLTFTIHELAAHPEVQQRARDEINAVIAKHNGEFTYESMNELNYLDQVISGKFI